MASDVGVTLRGIGWDHPRAMQPLQASIEPYLERTGVRVEWEARSLKDFGDAPIDDLAAQYDLLIIDHPHVGLGAGTGCLEPLDAHLDATTLETLSAQSAGQSHHSYRYAGHQWALAIDAATQAAAYRSDLLTAAELATSRSGWTGTLDVAQQLRARGLWLVMPLAPTDSICAFLSLCSSLGEPVAGGNRLISQAVGLKALGLLRSLRDASHPDSRYWNPIKTFDAMSTRDDLAYCPLAFLYSNYARTGFQKHLLSFTDMPGVRGSCLGGTGFAVSAHSTFPRAAAEYGAWLCSAEVQSGLYTVNGGQPGNLVAWQDANANRITHEFFAATLNTILAATVRPRFQTWPEFQAVAGDLIHAQIIVPDQVSEADLQACLLQLETTFLEHLNGLIPEM